MLPLVASPLATTLLRKGNTVLRLYFRWRLRISMQKPSATATHTLSLFSVRLTKRALNVFAANRIPLSARLKC